MDSKFTLKSNDETEKKKIKNYKKSYLVPKFVLYSIVFKL